MAKFIYKMENILNIKYKLEEEAKNVYGAARAMLNLEEEKLQNLYEKQAFYEEQLKQLCTSTLDILAIRKCEDAIEIMKYNIKLQIIAVNNAKMQLEKARIKLNEAMVDRKTHEKLKENAFESFKEEIKGQEKKEVDELVSFKFKKKSSSEDE
jgi:flagellar FliJ protein